MQEKAILWTVKIPEELRVLEYVYNYVLYRGRMFSKHFGIYGMCNGKIDDITETHVSINWDNGGLHEHERKEVETWLPVSAQTKQVARYMRARI
jgi:hypothetical protein